MPVPEDDERAERFGIGARPRQCPISRMHRTGFHAMCTSMSTVIECCL